MSFDTLLVFAVSMRVDIFFSLADFISHGSNVLWLCDNWLELVGISGLCVLNLISKLIILLMIELLLLYYFRGVLLGVFLRTLLQMWWQITPPFRWIEFLMRSGTIHLHFLSQRIFVISSILRPIRIFLSWLRQPCLHIFSLVMLGVPTTTQQHLLLMM